MAALISEVEAQFADHLAKAEEQENEKLAKSEEVESSEEQVKAEAQQEDNSVKKSEEAQASETEFDYDDEDIQEMDKMYASMTKTEAAAHLESLKRAHGIAEQATEKSEAEVVEKTEEKEDNDLLKSEIESVKQENSELKKSLEKLTSALTKFVKKGEKAPKQKAITKIEYVKKSEDDESLQGEGKKEDIAKLSKSDIAKRLSEKIRSGSLEKSEREKITQYYDNGQTNIDSIKHLL